MQPKSAGGRERCEGDFVQDDRERRCSLHSEEVGRGRFSVAFQTFLVLLGLWWNHLRNSTNSRIKKGDRTRPPPRGGRRGHEWTADAWQKTSGRGRDGGSTAFGRRGKCDSAPAMNETIPLRMDHAEACIDGPPQYSPLRPSLPLRTRNPQAIFLRTAPPSRRGANACALSILQVSLHNLPAILPVHYDSR